MLDAAVRRLAEGVGYELEFRTFGRTARAWLQTEASRRRRRRPVTR